MLRVVVLPQRLLRVRGTDGGGCSTLRVSRWKEGSCHTWCNALPCCCCAALLQAEYQADKLRAFPHVHSPARLIRALVRPSGKAAAAAAALPAADGKENATATA